MKELIESIAKSIVDHPDAVRVNAIAGQATTVFEIRVASDDMGQIIGKSGKNANAVRTLLHAAGMRDHRRYSLEILE